MELSNDGVGVAKGHHISGDTARRWFQKRRLRKAISYTVGFRQSKTALFDWIRLVLLLIVSRVDFIVFELFLEAVGVRKYCCGTRNSVGSSVLRAFLASNACFMRDEHSSKRVGGVGLSRKPPKLRSWRCTQPRAAKATAGVAFVGKIASITRATAVV